MWKIYEWASNLTAILEKWSKRGFHLMCFGGLGYDTIDSIVINQI